MSKVVLVHGAQVGPWCWDGVVAELGNRGIAVDAVELPLTSFSDDIDTARSAVLGAGAGVVVCGHSYGGCVISGACAGLSEVKRLVYLCAGMLDEGEDPVDLIVAANPSLGEALVVDEAAGTYTVDPGRRREIYFGDSDASLAEQLSARFRPMPLGDSWILHSEPAWRSISSTYVITMYDKCIAPSLQTQMAGNAEEVLRWPCDHMPMITRPGDIADLLQRHTTG
jgi:pimeloyl-ACP methyl ester carboxylesterase